MKIICPLCDEKYEIRGDNIEEVEAFKAFHTESCLSFNLEVS